MYFIKMQYVRTYLQQGQHKEGVKGPPLLIEVECNSTPMLA